MLRKNLINKLNARLAFLSKVTVFAERILKDLPSGILRIHKNNRSVTYYYLKAKEQGKGKMIDRDDTKFVKDLAARSYYEKVLRSAKDETRLIKQFISRLPEHAVEDISRTLSEERQKLITPIVLADDEYKNLWLSKPYEQKGFSEGEPFYMTQNGERVRSKSEQIIADHLKARGIPYKYECPLKLKNKTVYPDFTILRLSDRKEIYYEHLGKMGDQNYADKNIMKMNEYALSGYLQGRDIFTTMETQQKPLDARVLDKMIDDLFM